MTEASEAQIVALFGGSFDPPHTAHQFIPLFLLEHHFAEHVWYVPVKHHPFGKTVSSDQHRVAMLELLVDFLKEKHPELEDKLCIETHEIEQDGTSYTIDTLESLAKKFPQYSFRWVIGSDNVQKFAKWERYQDILQKFGVFVYPRDGYPATPLLPGMVYLQNAPVVKVSSTEVRQHVSARQSIDELALPAVAKYISTQKLYQ